MLETIEKSFTIEELKEIDKEVKIIPMTFDLIFKNVFENNTLALKRFLISVLHLDIEPHECKLKMSAKELPISHYKEYRKTVDINVVINDTIFINIELNKTSFNKVRRRNHLYHNKIVSLTLKRGDKIELLNEMLNIQLNLNAFDKSVNIGEDVVVPYSLKTNSIYIDNDIIYLRYLDYYNRMYYNKFVEMKEDELWLAALTSTSFYELNDILSRFLDDDLRIKLVKDVIRLSMDDVILDEYERRTLELIAEMDSKRIDREEAIAEGHAEGRAEEAISIIKSMIKKGISYEDINEITGKTKEEIKEIEKTMK